MYKKFFVAFLVHLLFASGAVYSQKNGVELLCSPRKDSVLLRWAPTNQKVWKVGNQYGYTVLRYTILRDKKIPKEVEVVQLNSEPLRPRPLTEWEPLADDKYVGIAGECIFNDEYKGVSTGGNPFIVMKKYKNETHRFSFALYAADLSVMAARLSGLYLADKTAKPNEKYLYKVFIPVPDSIMQVDTASAFTGISEYQPLPKPFDFKAEWADKVVTLSWNFKYLQHIYNSYIVERSEDKGNTYRPIREGGIVPVAEEGVTPELLYVSDTLQSNNLVYYYRVRGISAFGELGPPSDSLFGKGTLPITVAPVIVENSVIDNNKVKLTWTYPEEMNSYISGFRVYSSSKPKGRKTRIYESKQATERSFVDSTPDITNYYLISVFNPTREKFSSNTTYAELVDSFPPAPPQKLAGFVDSVGRVTVRWSRNTDKDLEGYRVYSSNNPNFEFLLETPGVIPDTVFTDSISIKTLTRNIYYKVRAIDVRQNQSDFSEMLTLARPDVIPPVSPVIKSIAEQDGSIVLSWANSSSDDLAYHRLYRREKSDSLFTLLAKLARTNDKFTTYTDKHVENGKEYIYYLKAEDSGGLMSKPTKTVSCKTPGVKESIVLKSSGQTGLVKLTWTVKSNKKVARVIIYRSVNGSPMQLYGNSTTDSYFDNKLSPEKTYEYRIKIIYTDDSSSEFSNTIKVKM